MMAMVIATTMAKKTPIPTIRRMMPYVGQELDGTAQEEQTESKGIDPEEELRSRSMAPNPLVVGPCQLNCDPCSKLS